MKNFSPSTIRVSIVRIAVVRMAVFGTVVGLGAFYVAALIPADFPFRGTSLGGAFSLLGIISLNDSRQRIHRLAAGRLKGAVWAAARCLVTDIARTMPASCPSHTRSSPASCPEDCPAECPLYSPRHARSIPENLPGDVPASCPYLEAIS
jgi:hypothetical protein